MSTRATHPQDVLVPIEQATVRFYGRELVAISLPDGRIAAVLRWLCEGMGIDVQAQLRRNQRKAALRDELVIVRVETDGGPQSMPALNLRGLAGWLYGIDETRLNAEARKQSFAFSAKRPTCSIATSRNASPHCPSHPFWYRQSQSLNRRRRR